MQIRIFLKTIIVYMICSNFHTFLCKGVNFPGRSVRNGAYANICRDSLLKKIFRTRRWRVGIILVFLSILSERIIAVSSWTWVNANLRQFSFCNSRSYFENFEPSLDRLCCLNVEFSISILISPGFRRFRFLCENVYDSDFRFWFQI